MSDAFTAMRGTRVVAIGLALLGACGGITNQSTRRADEDSGPDAAVANAEGDAAIGARDGGAFVSGDGSVQEWPDQVPIDASASGCGDYPPRPDYFEEYARAGLLGVYEAVGVGECTPGSPVPNVVLELRVACVLNGPQPPKLVRYGGPNCVSAKAWSVGELAVLGADRSPALASCADASHPSTDGVARLLTNVFSIESGDSMLATFGCPRGLGGP